MSPAEIQNTQGQTLNIISGNDELLVTRADGQQGIITSVSPDGFAFSGSIPRRFKSGKTREPVPFTETFGPGPKCKSQQLDLIKGGKAIAINDLLAECLNEIMGR